MQLQIDFDSEEALYIQLRNQIIYGIATRQYREGDSLPSVRQLADAIGINMHTVNKAYAVLREEGLLRLGRRTGAVIAVDIDKLKALDEMRDQLGLIVAKGFCKGITREEIHQLIDEIYSEFE
ncbi:MAG: GntR family transcriptional regulator [Clostridiales bacterium]|nr:GntR family transcriptional regulator [Clostridiales bacterium]